MSRRCAGCGGFMGHRQIACPACRKLIPEAIREDLLRLWFRGEWWGDSPLWERTLAAARKSLLAIPRDPARKRFAARKVGGVPL